MSTSKRRASCVLSLAGAALTAGLLAPSIASAAWVVGEQVDRGDGPGGASPWGAIGSLGWITPTTSVEPRPFAITNDGRYAFISYTLDHSQPNKLNLYRRDIQANTLRVVADDVSPTGFTTAGDKLSVVTSRALTAADTNTTGDLYLLDPLTGAATLASTGANGAALGGIATGAISADGTAIVYSTAAGTFRRALSGAATTKLSGRKLETYFREYTPFTNTSIRTANLSRNGLSSDGSRAILEGRYVAGVGITEQALGEGADASIAPNGASVVYPVASSSTTAKPLAIQTLATQARRTVSVPLPETAISLVVLGVSADGTKATVNADFNVPLRKSNTPNGAVGTVSLATGVVTKTSDDLPSRPPEVISANDRYGLAEDRRRVFAIPTVAGAAIPGGIDGASPNVYFGYLDGCLKPNWIVPDGRPTLEFSRSTPDDRGYALVSSALSMTVRQVSNGAVLNRTTLSSSKPTQRINAVYSGIKIEAVASFPGKPASTDVAYVPSHVPDDCYGNNGF